jgi:hypothetical protein
MSIHRPVRDFNIHESQAVKSGIGQLLLFRTEILSKNKAEQLSINVKRYFSLQ